MSYEKAPRALATTRVLPGVLRSLRVSDREALGDYEAVSGIGPSGDYKRPAPPRRKMVPVYSNRLLIGWSLKGLGGLGDVTVPIPDPVAAGCALWQSGALPVDDPALQAQCRASLGLPAGWMPGMPVPTTAAPGCQPGTVREPVTGWCLPDGSGKSPCAPGTRADPSAGCVYLDAKSCPPDMAPDPLGISCWPKMGPAPMPVPAGGCPTNWMKDPLFGQLCLPTTWAPPPLTADCLPNQYKDWAGNCLPKPQTAPPGPPPAPPYVQPAPPTKQAGLFGEPLFWGAVGLLTLGAIVVLAERSKKHPLPRAA